MLRRVQRLISFRISEFKVAQKAMQQTENQEWRQRLATPVKEKLEYLYRQATEGYKQQTPYYGIQNDDDEVEFWSRHMGQSKQRAEEDYVTFVHDVLVANNAEECISQEH